jgi:hypothetical protein
MYQPTHFPTSREGLSDEQLRVLAHDLRALYTVRLSQEAVISLGDDEALLSRYFACQKAYREREQPHKKAVAPAIPWHEQQHVSVIVGRVASETKAGVPPPGFKNSDG